MDASSSTLPIVIFGGRGNDVLKGGSSGDVIFGDMGAVAYTDPAAQAVASQFSDAYTDFSGGKVLFLNLAYTVNSSDVGNGVCVCLCMSVCVRLCGCGCPCARVEAWKAFRSHVLAQWAKSIIRSA